MNDDCEVHVDDGDSSVSGRWKKFLSKFDRCRHLLIGEDELDVSTFLNRLLDCLIAIARRGAPLFATSFCDIATPSNNTLRNRIRLLEQQLQTGEEKRKARSPIFSVDSLLLMIGFEGLPPPPKCYLSDSQRQSKR